MNTAHLFPDNSTFASHFLYALDRFDFEEKPVILLYFDTLPEVLIPFQDKYDIRVTKNIQQLEKILQQFDSIVFHSLYPHYLNLILNLKDKQIGWVFWGYEYYNYFETGNYEPVTKPKVPTRSILKQLAAFYRRKQLQRVFKRVDTFYFWDKNFYQELKYRFGMKAEFKEFLYGRPLLEPHAPAPTNQNSKLSIYVGNSAYLSGNQLDVFSKISGIDIDKVYALLAYGFDSHKSVIEKAGRDQFGTNFISIDTFLPFDEYLEMIGKVDVIICYHNRMQALGLIFNSILMQKALVINPNSHFYSKLTEMGITLFRFEDLEDPTSVRDYNTLAENRQILLEMLNSNRIRSFYSNF